MDCWPKSFPVQDLNALFCRRAAPLPGAVFPFADLTLRPAPEHQPASRARSVLARHGETSRLPYPGRARRGPSMATRSRRWRRRACLCCAQTKTAPASNDCSRSTRRRCSEDLNHPPFRKEMRGLAPITEEQWRRGSTRWSRRALHECLTLRAVVLRFTISPLLRWALDNVRWLIPALPRADRG